MKEKKDERIPKDPLLDIPAEADTEKHIDFPDIEGMAIQENSNNKVDKETEERQKQWKEGLEEGREERNRSL